jgi:hypothetical protein
MRLLNDPSRHRRQVPWRWRCRFSPAQRTGRFRDDDLARASLRFGLSRFTTDEEIDAAAGRLAAGVARLRAMER